MKILKYIVIMVLFTSASCDDSVSTAEGTPLAEVPFRALTATELMDKAQEQSIRYFWDYANSNSKLAVERVHFDGTGYDQNLVTTGGAGMGLLNLLVASYRQIKPEAEVFARLQTAVNFLETADRFHGAWPHWMRGDNGDVVPFFEKDNGGDLVETAFLCQALICIREKYKNGTAAQQALAVKADNLWKGVEWNWYTDGQNVLHWHWSPQYGFEINHELYGYNETLITYVLAAASPTYPITQTVFQNGWQRNGGIANSGSRYGLPVVVDHAGASGSVGSMFFSHYSFLCLDPSTLTDQYVNYDLATKNHAKIQQKYSIENPKGWGGYSDKVWGLTASESRTQSGGIGYFAHGLDNNDTGVISPTAAISSLPYAYDESIKFLKYCYEDNPSKVVGICGPYDAFSIHYDWYIKRYLAIDVGPQAPMIENHRSSYIWNLFMNAPDVRNGLINLGFHSTKHEF